MIDPIKQFYDHLAAAKATPIQFNQSQPEQPDLWKQHKTYQDYQAQKRKQQLLAQVQQAEARAPKADDTDANSLRAAGTANERRTAKAAEEVSEETLQAISRVYRKWADNPGGTLEQFSRDLAIAVDQDIVDYLEGYTANHLRNRGIPIPTRKSELRTLAEQAAEAVTSPAAVSDLYDRIQNPEKNPNLFLGDKWSRQRYIHMATQADSEFEQALLERDLASANPQLTGRRKWQVADPAKSRNRELHGQVRDANEPFTFNDGTEVLVPRPIGVNDPARWSSEKSFLLYETVDGKFI